MAIFLFVHGAWQGAWAWDKVVAELARRGHRAHAFDLPGSGQDGTPAAEVTMDRYAQAIAEQARRFGGEKPVLVGHSMGGMAVAAAAERSPSLFEQLVFVGAFVPRPGDSVGSLAAEGASLGGASPQAERSADGLTTRLREDSIAGKFFNDCGSDVAAACAPKFGAQAMQPFQAQAVVGENFNGLRKSYVLCTRDHAVHPQLQRRMAQRTGIEAVHEMDSGHEPFLSKPEEFCALLLRITGH